MAIAFNSSADLGNNGGSTNSLTASYTVSGGANRLLIVEFLGDAEGGNDDITSVTYGGVPMQEARKITNIAVAQRFPYFYFLLNPLSGANNVVITAGSSHYILAGARDYTGVAQSGQPDASVTVNPQSSPTTVTATLTTVADNCWAMMFTQQFPGPATAGTGSTERSSGVAFGNWSQFDSNGPITPPGMTSMTANDSSGTLIDMTAIMVSFAPATAITGTIVVTEGNDTVVATGAVGTTGGIVATERSDTAALTGTVTGKTTAVRGGAMDIFEPQRLGPPVPGGFRSFVDTRGMAEARAAALEQARREMGLLPPETAPPIEIGEIPDTIQPPFDQDAFLAEQARLDAERMAAEAERARLATIDAERLAAAQAARARIIRDDGDVIMLLAAIS